MKILALLSLVFSSLLAYGSKIDYISFECVGVNAKSFKVIFISKRPIPKSELVGSFDYSPQRFDYVISYKDFLFIEKKISSTIKQRFQERNDNGILVNIRKNNIVTSYFISEAAGIPMLKNMKAYLNYKKDNKNLIADLENIKWVKNFPAPEIKKDYISFDRIDFDWLSTGVVYISNQPIASSQLVGRYEDSAPQLNYILSKHALTFIMKIINSTPKKKTKLTAEQWVNTYLDLSRVLNNTFIAKDSSFKEESINTNLEKFLQQKRIIGIFIKTRINRAEVYYFIKSSDAGLMFKNILSYLGKQKGNADLKMDLENLNWSNRQPDSVKNDYIEFEYRGDANKPMYVIWIGKKPLIESDMVDYIEYDDHGLDFTVHNDEYLFLKKTIDSARHKTFEEKDYNGFKIHFRENGAYKYYFIRRKDSNALFLKAAAYLKHHKRNNDLIDYLNILRLGNVFPD